MTTLTQSSRTGYCTFDPLFQVFAWSMGCLRNGASPTHRHDGSEFSPRDRKDRLATRCDLPRAALLQVRGDWEWLCQCFRFRHFSVESFCWLCDATYTGPNSYLNVSPDAPYRQRMTTHDRFPYRAKHSSANESYKSVVTFPDQGQLGHPIFRIKSNPVPMCN